MWEWLGGTFLPQGLLQGFDDEGVAQGFPGAVGSCCKVPYAPDSQGGRGCPWEASLPPHTGLFRTLVFAYS